MWTEQKVREGFYCFCFVSTAQTQSVVVCNSLWRCGHAQADVTETLLICFTSPSTSDIVAVYYQPYLAAAAWGKRGFEKRSTAQRHKWWEVNHHFYHGTILYRLIGWWYIYQYQKVSHLYNSEVCTWFQKTLLIQQLHFTWWKVAGQTFKLVRYHMWFRQHQWFIHNFRGKKIHSRHLCHSVMVTSPIGGYHGYQANVFHAPLNSWC